MLVRSRILALTGLCLLASFDLPLTAQEIESEELRATTPEAEAATPEPSSTAPAANRYELEVAAEEQYLQGNLDAAATLYEQLGRVLDDREEKLRYWVLAAWLRSELGESLRAKDLLVEGLRIHPEHELPAQQYPQPFVELYRSAEAVLERERLETLAGLVQEGVAALEAGTWDLARERLDRALTVDPEHPTALYNRALVDLQTENDQSAIDTFERLAALDIRDDATLSDPLRARVEASLGLLYLRRDFFEDARTHLRTALDLDPAPSSSWTNLGLALRGLADEEAALEAFRRAWELSPGSPTAANNLATSYLRSNRPAEAVEILRGVTQQAAADPGYWLNLGLAERDLGNLEAAGNAFRRSLELDPTGSEGRVAIYLALVEYQRGEYPAAEAAASLAVELDPAAVESWIYLGLARQKQEEIVEAQEAFRRAIELDPERPESHNNLGTVLVALGDHQGAAEAFRRAVELDPDFAAARTNLAQIEAALTQRRAIAEEETGSRRRTKELGVRFDHTDFSYLGIRGAVVEEVKPRSPADRGGLLEGDIILGVDGRKIDGPDDFVRYVYQEAPADTIQVDILRDNRPKRLSIEIR